MKPSLITLSLVALMAASPSFAQEEAASETETTTEASDAATAEAATDAPAAEETGDAPAAADSQILDTGEAVTPENSSYVKETIGDWAIQCLSTPDRDDPCQLYQVLKGPDGGAVAEISLFPVENQGQAVAGANFIVPLETLLTQKLTVQVDSGQAKRYDFAFCSQLGCVARVGFLAQDIASFKAGNVANVTIIPAVAPDQKVTVQMSLSGFTAAYNALTQ